MPPKRHLPQKRACDACYRRKIQCSHPNPDGPCEWCSHRSIECTFNREKPQKKQRTSDVQNLLQRIQQLEGALSRVEPTSPDSTGRDAINLEQSTTPGTSNVISPPNISTPASSREQIAGPESSLAHTPFTQNPLSPNEYPQEKNQATQKRSASQWGPNWYFNGMPMSSEAGRGWISSRTGQKVTWADFSIQIMESSSNSALRPAFSQDLCELPDKEATAEIMKGLFGSHFRLHFPVLDEVLFETTIETAYGSVDGSLPLTKQISAQACVLSALSIASRVNVSSQTSFSIDVDLCVAKAHGLLLSIAEDTSLSTLETALVLQIQHVFHADWQGAAFFRSITCRIVCALGGHLYYPPRTIGPETSRVEREIQHTRRLFWLCYMLDKDISLFTGNPPLLTDIYCDFDLPDSHFDHYTYLPGLIEPFTNDQIKELTPHLPGDPRLSHLKEKVFRKLLSARGSRDNDNQLLLNIRQLDDEIEHWRLSIPANYRPVLSVSKNTSPSTSDEGIPHFIYRMSLQLDYHHLMTFIHTPVRKCTMEASTEIPDLHSVVHSSFDLSLMASRSTMCCLRILVNEIGGDAFRFVTFYSPTAALSLFLNIVIHPLNSQSRLDLEVLMSAANLIRGMPKRTLTQRERLRVQETGNFVMRLVWLGTCAVTKAEKDECEPT